MFGNFTEEARQIIVRAKKEMYNLKHPYVGSEHLLLAILKEDNNVSKKLKEFDLTYDKLKQEIIKIIGTGTKETEWFLYTPLLKRIMENAIIDSKENNHGEVTVEHLFSSLLEEGEGVAIRIMIGMNIDIEKLYNEFSYKFVNKNRKNQKLSIEELGINLTEKAKNKELDPVIGRDDEIKRLMEILCRRTKNNPLLIGKAGVGKTAIVEELSRLIVEKDVPSALKNKKIISLDMASLVAGTKYRGEFEDRVRKILKEVEENDDIILFIDEIHTLVGAGGAEGAIDASNIFKPALARGKLRCIGATTTEEYKKYIKTDGALERRFQTINIEIPDKNKVKKILTKIKPIYEKYHNVNISQEMIDIITDLSEKYIYDRNEPDKSIDILDEVCSYVNLKETKEIKKYKEINKELQKTITNKKEAIIKNDFEKASKYKMQENKLMDEINNLELTLYNKKKNKKVTKEDIAKVIYKKTNIPVYELLNDNKKIIENINKNLKDTIIGQEKVIDNLMGIVKRLKMGFKENKCYSLMFCGPSGVGKTLAAKTFGKNLVGENVIKLDMTEFIEPHSVSKIIGTSPGYVGYEDQTNILEEIKNKPYGVLILDEIEKAHPNVINLFLQILDDGKIKDSKGNIVRFDNITIIMTSNIGFDDINIGFNKNNKTLTKLKETFSIPFINRIDNIIIFNTLNKENIEILINKKLKCIKEKYLKNIDLKIDNKVYQEIIEESNYQEFGARKIDKIIKDKIENQIIDKIINKEEKIYIEELIH